MTPRSPDSAEFALADQVDDLIPSYGYDKVPVVGLGGSAGSIEALQAFFGTMPQQENLAFVVVIHLSPEHESVLSDVLQRCTRMPVHQVQDSLVVQGGHVYVIPPGRVLQWADGGLHVTPITDALRQTTVDVFFRTLADSHGPHAAAVVLSGLDGDGAIGIKRIKERGGLTIAQDPAEALHPSMPRSAIDTGMVDWTLPVADMPSRLLTYFRLEKDIALPPEDPAQQGKRRDESDLRDILNFVRTRTARDFSNYKRATVLRRIGRRMQVNGVDNLGAYLNCLRTRPGECAALVQDLLISVTNFFRDSDCFDALQAYLPMLFQGKTADDAVRVWVVACATGEEAYSIAMMLSEHARTLPSPPQIQVFATDLDATAIHAAREGLYPAAITADVSEERLRRFFVKEHRGFRVRRELRELVLFAVHDVLKDSPFSRIDLATCRNLLIYLTRDAQSRVLRTLHFALAPQGKLMLGASESAEDSDGLFTVADKKNRIYTQRPGGRAGIPVPVGGVVRSSLEPPPLRDGLVISQLSATPRPNPLQRPEGIRLPGSWGELHLRLLEQVGPPSILIDADHEIIHLSPSAGRLLQIGGGEPTRNLLHVVHPALRIELRAALYQASQTRTAVEPPPTRLDMEGTQSMASLRIVPFQEGEHLLYLVLLNLHRSDQPQPASSRETPADPLAQQLDREIERLKSQLRDTVEQFEASTEELKASNGELRAMNEELRAATEELETSREELQSINEELTTVNQELKSKVEQLSHSNSDMQNLMDATAIATVFLDRELRVMRYTPSAVGLFNLIPSDVGRPLTDMATRLDYPELGADARRVLDKLVAVEREVGQADGSWYLARLMPYRTLDDRIAGVVFTFIDITERKRAEEMRLWLSAVVSATSDAIVSFAPDGTILSWNAGAERIFGYTPAEAIGQSMDLLAPGREAEQERVVADVMAGRSVEDVEVVRRRKDGSDIHVGQTVSPIRDTAGKVVAGTAMARDRTAARASAEALRMSEERLRMLVESAVEYAIFTLDLQRRVTSWNSGAQRLLGFAKEDILGKTGDVIFTPEDRESGAPQKECSTALEHGRAADERMHMRRDGSRFRGSGIMMVMRNDAGEAVGFVKILRDLTRREPDPD